MSHLYVGRKGDSFRLYQEFIGRSHPQIQNRRVTLYLYCGYMPKTSGILVKNALIKCSILGQTGDSAFTNLHIAETTIPNNRIAEATIPNNRIAEATIQNYCITEAVFSNYRIAETIFLNRKFFIELHAEKNFRLMTTFIVRGLQDFVKFLIGIDKYLDGTYFSRFTNQLFSDFKTVRLSSFCRKKCYNQFID